MSYYAVIDTNVLVSALLTRSADSATAIIKNKILSREIVPVYSLIILSEYREVLYRKKFHLPSSIIDPLLAMICKYGISLDPTPTGEILPDVKDLPFYEVVMEKRKTGDAHLVTGNTKHFPKKPFIVTPREMLDIIDGAVNNGTEKKP